VNVSGLQTNGPVATACQPRPLPSDEAPEIRPCWNEIGVQGDTSCAELQKVSHCRNCRVYSGAALHLLDRPLLPDYRRAWAGHLAQERQLARSSRTSALLFRVNSEWLALPARAFQEVADRRLVHSLPHRRQSIVLGLVNIRGELLICVSLGHLLGLDKAPIREAPRAHYDRLLVAAWDGLRFVFPADEVRGIHRFQTPELVEPPATLSKAKSSYTLGLLRWEDQVVGLLNAELLFSAINRSLA